MMKDDLIERHEKNEPHPLSPEIVNAWTEAKAFIYQMDENSQCIYDTTIGGGEYLAEVCQALLSDLVDALEDSVRTSA